MQVDIDLFDTALDGVFKDVGLTYKVKLISDVGTYENTVAFTTASGGATQLSATTYFAVSSGTTISGVQIIADVKLGEKLLDIDKTFTSNGTFTVSNIVVSLV